LFEKSDSTDFSYIVPLGLECTDKVKDYFRLIGKLIAKALLENVTINLCFNKLIYKIILSEITTFEDLMFINKPVRICLSIFFINKNYYNDLIDSLLIINTFCFLIKN